MRTLCPSSFISLVVPSTPWTLCFFHPFCGPFYFCCKLGYNLLCLDLISLYFLLWALTDYCVICRNLCIYQNFFFVRCSFSRFCPHAHYHLFISVFINLSWTLSCFSCSCLIPFFSSLLLFYISFSLIC